MLKDYIPHLHIHRDVYELFLEKHITSQQAFFLSVVDSLTKRGKGCTATNKWFADLFNCNNRTISDWISVLAELGVLVVTNPKSKRRSLRLPSAFKVNKTTSQKSATSTTQHSRNQRRPYYTSYNTNNNNTPSQVREGVRGFFDLGEVKGVFTPLADKLFQAVMTKGLRSRPANIKVWAKDLEKLHTLDDIPIGQIEYTLDWYINNMTKRYMPKAYSTKAFREKFDAIENKMREQGLVYDKPFALRVVNEYNPRCLQCMLPALRDHVYNENAIAAVAMSLQHVYNVMCAVPKLAPQMPSTGGAADHLEEMFRANIVSAPEIVAAYFDEAWPRIQKGKSIYDFIISQDEAVDLLFGFVDGTGYEQYFATKYKKHLLHEIGKS